MSYKRISPQPVVEGGTGAQSFTPNSLLLGQGTTPITALGAATNGQIPIGSTGVDPVLGTITQGTGISIVNGAGSITISADSSVATTYNADSGSATAALNVLTVAGSGSITTSASGSTVTTALTGLTQYNVLVGAGTSTITKVAPSATSGVPLVSQGAAADPVFGTASVAGGGTGATTLTGVLTGNGTSPITGSAVTQYTVLLGDASNAVTNVSGTGTSGQVLTSNGAGAAPTWQASGSGSGVWVLIDTQTASTSSYLEFTGLTDTYQSYVVILDNVRTTSGSAVTLEMLFSNDNGSSYYGSSYKGGYTVFRYSGADGSTIGSFSTSSFSLARAVSTDICGANAYISLFGIGKAVNPRAVGNVSWCTNSDFYAGPAGVVNNGITTINAIKFKYTSGNIASGTITLYGIT